MVDWIPIFFSEQPLMIHETVAEGVGFEPTVGYPTLDFESSALNRTQPPFLGEPYYGRTRGICNRNRAGLRPASDRRKVLIRLHKAPIGRCDQLAADSFHHLRFRSHLFGGRSTCPKGRRLWLFRRSKGGSRGSKKFTIKGLLGVRRHPHVVVPLILIPNILLSHF